MLDHGSIGGVDQARYPLHDPEARGRIVSEARRALAADGWIAFPGFVGAEAVARMAREAEAAVARGFRRDQMLGPGVKPDPAMPADHPARRTHPYRMDLAATDLLPSDGLIRRLYQWDGLTDLVRDAIGEPVLYRCADPLVSCVTTHMGPDDQHGWHFDGNDFVVSLLLQKAESGGAFEVAPAIRTPDDEAWDAVGAAMDGRWPGVRTLPVEPGTLLIFQGKYALHRVTPVAGARRRIIALFSYDRLPGMVFPDRVRLNATGRLA
jgi:hypothetical protein